MTGEVQQQVKFSRSQGQRLRAFPDLPADGIDGQVTDGQVFRTAWKTLLHGFDSSENGLDACDQFSDGEWLRDIVVGTQFQPKYTVQF